MWIKGAQGYGAIASRGQLNSIVIEVGVTAHELLRRGRTLEVLPLRAAGQAFFQPAVMDAPFACKEIKIVHSWVVVHSLLARVCG